MWGAAGVAGEDTAAHPHDLLPDPQQRRQGNLTLSNPVGFLCMVAADCYPICFLAKCKE
jgi:hypothetical protein